MSSSIERCTVVREDGLDPETAVERALAEHNCGLKKVGPITPDHVRALAVVRR